ncbi:hypothetical protein BH09BAC2_BH09BAC2_09920 [soil metagenome]
MNIGSLPAQHTILLSTDPPPLLVYCAIAFAQGSPQLYCISINLKIILQNIPKHFLLLVHLCHKTLLNTNKGGGRI